jgi:hypothetical protein
MMEDRFGKVEVNGVVIYNTTPHAVKVVSKQGETLLEIPKAAVPLRIQEENVLVRTFGDVPLFEKSFLGVDLPPREFEVFYIVSLPVAQAVRRSDFIVPHDLVRDEAGNVIGCRGFARLG